MLAAMWSMQKLLSTYIRTTLVFLIASCVFAGQKEEINAAWNYLKNKKYPQALNLFSVLSLQDTENTHLKIGIARAKLGLGGLTEAEGLFRQLRQQENRRRKHEPAGDFCGHLQIELGLARCLQEAGRLTDAERLFRQLRQQENRRRKHEPAGDFCGHLQIELGLATCLDLTGDVEKRTAAEWLFRQLRQQENRRRKHEPAGDFCGHLQIELGLARCLQEAGRRTEAEWLFRQLRQQENRRRKHEPAGDFCGHLQIELGLARCLQEAGRLTDAEWLFRQLRQQENRRRKHEPAGDFCGHLQIELGLATCLDLTGDVEKRTEAEWLFRQLRQQENRRRKHEPAGDFCGHLQIELGLLACLNNQTGKPPETDQLATILLETFSTSHHWQLFHVIATTYFTLACKEIVKGVAPGTNKNLQSAMTMVKRSLQEKETPQALSLQGHIVRMMGRGQQAKELWTRACTLQPSRQQVPKREAWRQLEQAALDKLSSPGALSADTGQLLPQPPPFQRIGRPSLNPDAQPFVPGKIWSQ